RPTDTRRQRQDGNFTWVERAREITRFDSPKIKPVSDGAWARPGAGLVPGIADLLAQADFSFQALRGERCDIQAVVVEDRVNEFELVVIKQLRDRVADEPPLLQSADV